MNLIEFTQKGIYCPVGKFYVDPLSSVDTAIITHAHSDHSRFGSRQYFCSTKSLPLIKHRLGSVNIKGFDFGEIFEINGVQVSLHPAGHILGSSQVRVEYQGEVWVITGDYKVDEDKTTENFQFIECDYLVTESTFGLPIFTWEDQNLVFAEINDWWKENKAKGLMSVIFAYSLGKAQRVIANLDASIGPILTHGSVENMNQIYKEIGVELPSTEKVEGSKKQDHWEGGVVITPQSAMNTSWLRKFYPYKTAKVSGWMQIEGIKRRSAVDRGFAISDHADWEGLNEVVLKSKAQKVYVTHGYTNSLSRWIEEYHGIESEAVRTGWWEREED